jgi:hypothetical protein
VDSDPEGPYSHHHMPVSGETERQRASALESLGAWLRIWTPPRDVEVRPVPKRALLIAGAALLVLAIIVVGLVAPAIDEGKQRADARDQAAEDARREAAARRAAESQRPTVVSLAALRPPAGSSADERLAARAALVAEVEERITADAQARAAEGELRRPRGPTACERAPGTPAAATDLTVRRGVFDCDTTIRVIAATETNVAGLLTYPFRAVLDFATYRVAWCKTNPVPGEQIVPDPRQVVELPSACRS